ncbi:MAG: hypothetical protein WBV11_05925 [Salegentibacter sp.]
MKKAFATFFLLVFSFTIVGVYMVFGLQLFQVKREMMQKIAGGVEAGKLVNITASAEHEIVLFDGGKELRFKNTMYDVVKTEVDSNGKTFYHCLPDLEETALLAGFQKLIKAGSEHHDKNNTPLIFYKFLAEITPERHSQSLPNLAQKSGNFFYSRHYSGPEPKLSFPPPRTI